MFRKFHKIRQLFVSYLLLENHAALQLLHFHNYTYLIVARMQNAMMRVNREIV